MGNHCITCFSEWVVKSHTIQTGQWICGGGQSGLFMQLASYITHIVKSFCKVWFLIICSFLSCCFFVLRENVQQWGY